jgi:long-chain acyl-CoA synthetase
MFGRKKSPSPQNGGNNGAHGKTGAEAPGSADVHHRRDAGSDKTAWRLIYNPEGDPADVVAYGAAVAEGRIAGKYQLSTTRIPSTVIVQRSRVPGIVAGADVKVDVAAAEGAGISIARAPRQGRNSGRTAGTLNLDQLMSRASRSHAAADMEPDDSAVILYTSGTTGNPKGVTLTHRNFHFQLDTVVRSLIPFTPEDRVVGVLPMYHVFGLANSLIAAIHYGACIVLVPQYSPANLIAAVGEHKATIMPAVPSMYQHLLAAARARNTHIPKCLRYCVSGGAALPLATLDRFMETFETRILEGYGLTETTSSVCVNGQQGRFKEGSIGPPAAGVEMKVVGDDGSDLPAGAVGEIAIRSETVFPGYWNNDAATREVLAGDGWFYTGDLGYKDEEGFFFITDRKKDIIITGGYNVSPREVEEVIMTHSKVADAAVVGVRGRRADAETITAFVVAHEGESLSQRDILELCAQELAAYKQPRAVRLVESLPKSATGKVLRSQLRGELEDLRLVEREEVQGGAV